MTSDLTVFFPAKSSLTSPGSETVAKWFQNLQALGFSREMQQKEGKLGMLRVFAEE